MKPSLRLGMMVVATLVFAWSAGMTPRSLAAQAPSVSFGAGVLSRYVWRGMPYSTHVQAQPWIQVDLGAFAVGAWGSYSADDYQEQDQYVTWTHPLPRGALAVTVSDYYFTEDFGDFFDWGGVEDGVATGPHTLEASVAYLGPEERPVQFLLASTFFNDPGPSVYAEAGYALDRLGLSWSAQVGCLLHDGGFYELGRAGLTNLTLSASRLLGTWRSRDLVSTGYLIHNPELGRTYLALEIVF